MGSSGTFAFTDGQSLTSTAITPHALESLAKTIVMQLYGLQPGTTATGTTTLGSNVLTVDQAGTAAAGQTIVGNGVPAGTTVASVAGNSITMSAVATASGSGLVSIGAAATANYAVRSGWQSQGQPGWAIDEDVTTVFAVPMDDPYNRNVDSSLANNSSTSVLETRTYTRCWELRFTLYGPNAPINARLLRSGLLLRFVHDLFAASNLFLIPDVAEIQRVPELFQQQWWERADVSVRLYEQVTETITVGTVASVGVTVETAAAEDNFTVPA